MKHEQNRILSFYTEIPELALVLLPLELHIAHMSPRGTMAAPVDKVINIFLLSLRHDFNGAIRAISYPPL